MCTTPGFESSVGSAVTVLGPRQEHTAYSCFYVANIHDWYWTSAALSLFQSSPALCTSYCILDVCFRKDFITLSSAVFFWFFLKVSTSDGCVLLLLYGTPSADALHYPCAEREKESASSSSALLRYSLGLLVHVSICSPVHLPVCTASWPPLHVD